MKVLGGTSKTANFWSRRPVLNISKGARDSMIWHLGDNVFLTKFNSFWRFCHVAYETNIWPTTVPKWLTSIQNYIFKLFRWLHAQIFWKSRVVDNGYEMDEVLSNSGVKMTQLINRRRIYYLLATTGGFTLQTFTSTFYIWTLYCNVLYKLSDDRKWRKYRHPRLINYF